MSKPMEVRKFSKDDHILVSLATRRKIMEDCQLRCPLMCCDDAADHFFADCKCHHLSRYCENCLKKTTRPEGSYTTNYCPQCREGLNRRKITKHPTLAALVDLLGIRELLRLQGTDDQELVQTKTTLTQQQKTLRENSLSRPRESRRESQKRERQPTNSVNAQDAKRKRSSGQSGRDERLSPAASVVFKLSRHKREAVLPAINPTYLNLSEAVTVKDIKEYIHHVLTQSEERRQDLFSTAVSLPGASFSSSSSLSLPIASQTPFFTTEAANPAADSVETIAGVGGGHVVAALKKPISRLNMLWSSRMSLPCLLVGDPTASSLSDKISTTSPPKKPTTKIVQPIDCGQYKYRTELTKEMLPFTEKSLKMCNDEKTQDFAMALAYFAEWDIAERHAEKCFNEDFCYPWPKFVLDLIDDSHRWKMWRKDVERKAVDLNRQGVRCHVYFSALRDGYESSLAQQAEELTTHTAAEESLVTLTSLQTPPSRYDWSAGELDLFIPCGLADEYSHKDGRIKSKYYSLNEDESYNLKEISAWCKSKKVDLDFCYRLKKRMV